MPHVFFRHKVTEFEKWKRLFEQHAAVRKNAGCTSSTIFRSAVNPIEAFVLCEWDTIEHAEAYIASNELRRELLGGGASGPPDVFFMEPVEQVAV
jgi:quinol monooxygenase YgiN